MPKSKYYEHFTSNEMEAIAAHVYAYQKFNTMYDQDSSSGMKRAWGIFDRFMLAVRAFHKVFEEHPADGLSFKIAKYNEASGTPIDSGNRELDPRDLQKSAEIYEALMSWNEKKLQSYVDGLGGKLNEKFGFKRLAKNEVAPLQVEKKTISDIDLDDLGEKLKGTVAPEPVAATFTAPIIEPITTDQPEPINIPEKKKAGRPKKNQITNPV